MLNHIKNIFIVFVFISLWSVCAQAQQIVLLDSGVDSDIGANLGEGFNYFNNSSDTNDASGEQKHGNESATAIRQSFLGPIIPLVVTDAQGNFAQETIAREGALSDALGRSDARVVAVTWGTNGVVGSPSPLIAPISNANKVVVIMAGNDSVNQPNVLATSSFNLPGVIVVGGSDAAGNILPTTNRAGTTQNRYVLLNGIRPSDPGAAGGSSWAAARAAGISAAVLQQNPQLTNEEVAQVIFLSATDVGAEGIDPESGRGFIANAAQVLNNPVGPLVIPEPTPEPESSGGGGGSSGGAGLLVGAAVVGAVVIARKPSQKLEKTLVLDSYGRGFQIDLNDYIDVRDGTVYLNDLFNALEQEAVAESLTSLDGRTVVSYTMSSQDQYLDMIDYFAMPDDFASRSDRAVGSIKFRQYLYNDFDYQLSFQAPVNSDLGVQSLLDGSSDFQSASFLSGQSFGSLLSGFANRANHVGIGYGGMKSEGLKLSANLVSSKEDQNYGLDSTSAMLNVSYQFDDNAALILQIGELSEDGSLFGGASGGVFGVDNASTQAINLGTKLKFSEDVQFTANYGIGRTRVDGSGRGFLSDFTELKSDWYSMGIIANKLFNADDQFGVAVTKPLQFTSGSATFSVPTARDFDGSVVFDSSRIQLSDTGATEHVLDMYYRTQVNRKMDLGAYLSYRHNPNHVDAESDALLMATLRYRLH